MWKLNFQTITPLHISNGQELNYNFDYIETNGYLRKFDMVKFSKFAVENKLFDFNREYSYKDVNFIIEKNKKYYSENIFKYSIECTNRALQQLRNEFAQGRNIVKEFVNSNGRFYIPASSVKGALATVLHRDSIGIRNSISQKFVVYDSDFISSENFVVDKTYIGRPSVQLICLKPFTEFSVIVKKTGDVSIATLKSKLKEYYKLQLNKAIDTVSEYVDNTKDETGANIFIELLEEYRRVQQTELSDEEHLINLGFGGGSYFKIFDDKPIPTNYNRKTRKEEKPHTTFSFYDGEFVDHIGWCKLTIEEE